MNSTNARRRKMAVVALLLVVTATGPALAALSGPCAVTDLVRESIAICAGKVTTVGPWPGAAGGPTARRTCQVRVARVLKGSLAEGQTLTVVLPDEPWDGDFDSSYGHSSFQLLFLCKQDDGFHLCKDSAHAAANSAIPVSVHAPPGTQPSDALAAVKREIVSSLQDPAPEVAGCAASILGEIGDSTDLPCLRTAQTSSNATVSSRALTALTRLGDASIMSQVSARLVEATSTGSVEIRDLYSAVAGLKNPALAQYLYRVLQSTKNIAAKRAVLLALRNMKTKGAIPTLQATLNDPSGDIRYQAVMALAETGGDYTHAPCISLYNADERKYIEYWKAWSPPKE